MGSHSVSLGTTFKKLSRNEMVNYSNAAEDVPVWSDAEGEVFDLRTGPNYTKNKKKSTSGPALYDCLSVDIIQSDSEAKISHIASMIDLDTLTEKSGDKLEFIEAIKSSKLPRVIIINIQIPHKEVSVMAGSNYYDSDNGCSLIMVFKINPETVKYALNDLSLSDSPLKQSIAAQIALLQKYNQHAFKDKDIKRRFKAILFAENWDDITGSALSTMKGYNGKPAIINNMGVIFQDEHKAEYLELDVKIRDAKYLSKKGLDLLRSSSNLAKVRLGFTIQGETDEELPENIFGCVKMTNVSLDPSKIKKVTIPRSI